MNSTAITANPFSYSQTCDTSRPRVRQGAATRTGLGGKCFVHFFKPRAMLNSLVRQFITEGRPASIKYGLRHAGFGESCRVHVTHGDVIELTNDAVRELVNEVATPRSEEHTSELQS